MWGFHDHALSMRKALNETLITSKANNSLYRRWRWTQSVQNRKVNRTNERQKQIFRNDVFSIILFSLNKNGPTNGRISFVYPQSNHEFRKRNYPPLILRRTSSFVFHSFQL